MEQPTYIFRLDDISWDMNTSNFMRIRDLFIRYGIRPLIGVIPCNKDEKLIKQSGEERLSREEFWREIKKLQDTYRWTIALHGFNHIYRTKNSGLFHINKRSEFAGIPFDEQFRMIREGKEILETHGLETKVFMAPAHSLDWNTVAALRENGIVVVTDGITAYPYRKRGVWFIPQVANWPNEKAWGIESVCFHINEWTEEKFIHFEEFLQNRSDSCCDFQTVIDHSIKGDYDKYRFQNLFSGIIMRIYVFVRAIRYRLILLKSR